MRHYSIIDKGPDGTWSFVCWHYTSKAAADEALPFWKERYPRSQFVVIG